MIAPPIAPPLTRALSARLTGVAQFRIPLPIPLPANAYELWSGEYGASATAARGMLRGITLNGVNSPTVAADGSGFFAGRPVFQSSATGTRGWSTTFGTDIFPDTETQTFAYVIGRYVTGVGAADQWLIDAGRSFTGNIASISLNTSNQLRCTTAGGSPAVNGFADTSPHRWRAYKDSAGRSRLCVDACETIAPTAGSPSNQIALNAFGIGVPCGAWGQAADANIALLLICRGVPTDAELAALDAWAISYYQLPDTPETILGTKCQLWLHGNRAVPGLGTRITEWSDSSGKNYALTQGTLAKQPNRTGTVDSRAVMNFLGSSAQVVSKTGLHSGILAGAQPEVFLVARCTTNPISTAASGYFVLQDTGAAAWNISQEGNSLNSDSFLNGFARATAANGAGVGDAWQMYRFRLTPNMLIERDGVSVGTNAASPSLQAQGNTIAIGQMAAYFLTGDLAEVIVVSPACSASELTRLTTYLSASYPSLTLPIQ